MPGSILGHRVRRLEDPELLVGRGTSVANMQIGRMLHVAFVRSPFAHARLVGIDVAAARAMPEVVAVWTAADLGLEPMHSEAIDGRFARPPLAVEKVRFVGEAVVAVIAQTMSAAVDAVEMVEVDYEALPAVADPVSAVAPDAPLLFEEAGTNIVRGLRDADAEVLAGAEVVVRATFENQRVAVVPIESNSIIVIPPIGAEDPLTIYVANQFPHEYKEAVLRLGIDAGPVRVVVPHVGGSFGGKGHITAEQAVAIVAARRLDRPVAAMESRWENLVSMPHARAQIQWAELGLRRDGSITGLRLRLLGDCGSYAGVGGAFVLGPTYMMAEGVYHVPSLHHSAASVLTNTTTTGGVRGSGRPEATALLERLIDLAAVELELDPVVLRRRNLIGPAEFPYTTHTGMTYDTGDYDQALTEALRIARYDELRAEQMERRRGEASVQLGIGISVYVEVCAFWPEEWAAVELSEDGGAVVRAGTSAHGQGHATTYAMIVADELGVPVEDIRLIQSDTSLVPRGRGTGGSRSVALGGSAVRGAALAVWEQVRELAAELLEADATDIVRCEDGRVGVAGVPARALGWVELIRAALERSQPLAAEFTFTAEGLTFPFGAHVAVVEVDTDTGHVNLKRHIAVDDCGRVINQMIVDGQVHGGIAHGAAQALWEHFVYDPAGNPLTTSLVDYGVPSAAELPSFETANTVTPTPLNPLGAKGIGESATIGSTPAIQNAAIDALSHIGVRHINLPCTPERIWDAIQAARRGDPDTTWQEPPPIFGDLPVRNTTGL